ncbi:hypothetical protein AB0J83_03355 [Actinoplanes sp. NPDC049596]|uniref:hypothetical protein n=1 Tax=unclassified Actinoplanes TaxID=2626549 RepID=UPI003446BB00
MNTLAALRRAIAFDDGRAVPRASLRHYHLTDAPLVVCLCTVAGEPFAPWCLVFGTDPDHPTGSVVIAEPRDRTQRYRGLAAFAEGLCDYLSGHLAYDMVRNPLSGVEHPVTAGAPQIVVPTASVAEALIRVAGVGLRKVKGVPPVSHWCNAHLTWLGQRLETDGQALILPAATALTFHWATGQGVMEDANLPSVLEWLTSTKPTRDGRLADIAAAEQQAWGDQRDPARDHGLMLRVDRHNKADNAADREEARQAIADEVLPPMLAAYRGCFQALDLLRTLPEAPTAAERWTADKRAWAQHAKRCDAPTPPLFTVRDRPSQAVSNAAALETARARFTAQPVHDDPLILAEAISAGDAFTGEVLATDTTNMEIKPEGSRRTKVPLLTIRCRLRPASGDGHDHAQVWWVVSGRPVSGETRHVTPAARRDTDLPYDEPHTVLIALLSGHDHGRRTPAVGTTVTFTRLDPRPSNAIRPVIATPWPFIPDTPTSP